MVSDAFFKTQKQTLVLHERMCYYIFPQHTLPKMLNS